MSKLPQAGMGVRFCRRAVDQRSEGAGLTDALRPQPTCKHNTRTTQQQHTTYTCKQVVRPLYLVAPILLIAATRQPQHGEPEGIMVCHLQVLMATSASLTYWDCTAHYTHIIPYHGTRMANQGVSCTGVDGHISPTHMLLLRVSVA